MNDGVKRRSELEGKDNSSEDKGNYKVVCTGDMVYNSMRMWQGANGISPYNGIVSPAYTVLTAKCDISNGFFAALFKTHKLISEFCKHSQGMTSDTWNLKYPQIESIKTYIPSVAEQQKIAALIEKVDKRIAIQKELIDSLKKYKRGVSNKLFTDIQSDANNHTYRFSDMFKILQNNTLSRDMLCTEKTKVLNIHYGDVLIKYNAVTNIETTEIPYIKENIDLSKFSPISYLESGDVVFADTAEDYTVGKATEIQSENKVFILSGLHTIPCRPIIKFHKGYLGHYFNSSAYRTDILPLIQGTKVSSISKTELLKTSVVVPPLEQQRKVAKLLSAFDNKITNLELEVAKLIKLKSGLLQQLFI